MALDEIRMTRLNLIMATSSFLKQGGLCTTHRSEDRIVQVNYTERLIDLTAKVFICFKMIALNF